MCLGILLCSAKLLCKMATCILYQAKASRTCGAKQHGITCLMSLWYKVEVTLLLHVTTYQTP